MDVKGKVVIVTGAGAGIGEATAVLLASKGAKVVCNSLSRSAERVAGKINHEIGDAIFCQGDVSREEDVKDIVDKTIAKYGKIDVLVNNAGIVIGGTTQNTDVADWEKTMDVNVKGVFLMTKYALPYILENKGCIVNNASVAALKGLKNRYAYTASKGAVLSMTRAMAMDLLDDGVRVNCICPGTVESPSLDERLSKYEDPVAARKEFIARQPLGRLGKAEEIAEGIHYLITAEFCTGTNLSVDGGMTV